MEVGSHVFDQIKNSLMFKALIIGLILLVLMIPKSMIQNVISERSKRKDDVVREIGSLWGSKQYLYGPMLSIPYIENEKVTVKENDKEIEKVVRKRKTLTLLPDSLSIDGDVVTEERYRGIYRIDVYRADLDLNGSFSLLDEELSGKGIDPASVEWESARFLFGVENLNGIKEDFAIKWRGADLPFEITPEFSQYIQSGAVSKVKFEQNQENTFSVSVAMAGSGGLYFMPVANENRVNLVSNFSSPKFFGKHLPESREVSADGFAAEWKIYGYNRDYPKLWVEKIYSTQASFFGFELFTPVDEYQKSTRSIKYAILFISLLFVSFFFVFEVVYKRSVHPVQYFFSGGLMVLFYLLLLSLSEHISFNRAYWIASSGVISVSFFYMRGISSRITPVALISFILLSIFTFLFVILQMEDYSLLCGSIGLFVILAAIMLITRKVDWYNLKLQHGES